MARITDFADRTLGKGVVVARDTPNFIANHIGLHGVASILRAVDAGRYTIDEVDAITGPAIGRPGSATFRTMDIAGLDVLAHVLGNLEERLDSTADRAWFRQPALLTRLIERGALGEKTGRGFYERRKDAVGGVSKVYTLDPATLDYLPQQKPAFPSIAAAMAIEDVGARVKALFLGQDRVGAFLRETLSPTLVYAARVAPSIAHSIDDVDRAMRWGFGWDLGPFELIDAIGAGHVLEAAAAAGVTEVPPLLAPLTPHPPGAGCATAPLPPAGPGRLILTEAVRRGHVVRTNAGASLDGSRRRRALGAVPLEDERHRRRHARDAARRRRRGGAQPPGPRRRHRGPQLLGRRQPDAGAARGTGGQLGRTRPDGARIPAGGARPALQPGARRLVAPGGLALGGSCEIALHADRVHAAGDTFMGLVEVGVGLIPAGGGTKEMLARAMARRPSATVDPLPFVQQAFETVALAKVSASGPDAVRLGYLSAVDTFSMNRERLIADAKGVALQRVAEGYRPPVPPSIPVGGESLRAALDLGVHLAWRAGRATDHDATIGRALARVFAGGDVPHATVVSEQHLLDLEREAFLSLLGEAPDARPHPAHAGHRQALRN
ncbi:MAG: 3-hydroxyacyl-CoA dehydrogenase family protein [Vicinamibacterales bacterium]